MKWATPSESQARGDCIQAWVRAWARMPSSWSGWRSRTGSRRARGEQGAGFEGGVAGVGEVEEGELGAGTLAEPALEEWRDGGDGGGPGGEGGSSSGRAQRAVLAAAWAVRMATKRLGASKPRVVSAAVGGGDAGNFRIGPWDQ